MHEVFMIKSSKPIPKRLQKTHQFEKISNIFQKPKILGQKIWKCMKKKDKETYQVKKNWLRRKNPWGRGLEWEREIWEVKGHRQIERDQGKWRPDYADPMYRGSVILDK